MSSALHTIRYPSGTTEFRTIGKQPEVGDILTCNGDTWVVEEVDEAVVTLRPLQRSDSAARESA